MKKEKTNKRPFGYLKAGKPLNPCENCRF